MTFFILIVVVAGLLMMIRVKGSGGGLNDPHEPQVPATNEGIFTLLRQQKMIEAIKLYREIHNAGLKEAKDAVELMAATGHAPPLPAPGTLDMPVADADVVSMIRSGNMIDAIRMYRELHGTDLLTAKNAVEALAKTLPPA